MTCQVNQLSGVTDGGARCRGANRSIYQSKC